MLVSAEIARQFEANPSAEIFGAGIKIWNAIDRIDEIGPPS